MATQQTLPQKFYNTATMGFGKEFERATKKLFDPVTKQLTEDALRACYNTGIKPEDLYDKSIEEFLQSAENEEIAEMRFQHYEQRRKNKIRIISQAVNDFYREQAYTAQKGNMSSERYGEMFKSSPEGRKVSFFQTRLNRISSVHSQKRQGILPNEFSLKASEQRKLQCESIQSLERSYLKDLEKEKDKINKLQKVKNNLEGLVIQQQQKAEKKMKKQEKREKMAKDYQKGVKAEAKMKVEKLNSRRLHARELVEKNLNLNEKEGIKYYNQNIKEIEQRKELKEKKVRDWCEVEYENYKKKYETSINNYSIFYEKLRDMDRETKQNLTILDEKLLKGYDRSIILTSEKVQRASLYTEKVSKVLSDHDHIDQQKTETTLSKYVNKRIANEEKLSKRQKELDRQWKTQRRALIEKFEKFRLQRAEVIKEEEKKKKEIIEKHKKQEAIKNEAKSFIEKEINKKREWSNLRRSDQQENLSFNHKQSEHLKLRILDKHLSMKRNLDGMRESQQFIIEQRRKANLERRKLVESINETAHGNKLLSLSLTVMKGKKGKKLDDKDEEGGEKNNESQ